MKCVGDDHPGGTSRKPGLGFARAPLWGSIEDQQRQHSWCPAEKWDAFSPDNVATGSHPHE
jgi:hypothetical protein